MRDGHTPLPVPRYARDLFASSPQVTILQAPPAFDAFGVVLAMAEIHDFGPVRHLAVTEGEPGALTAQTAKALDELDGPGVLALTRREGWSLAAQTAVAATAAARPQARVTLLTGTPFRVPVAPGVARLSARDLALTDADVRGHVRVRLGHDDERLAARLTAATFGWPGLVDVGLSAVDAPGVTDPAHLMLAESAVHDEVRERVLPWLPDGWLDLLRYLAIADGAEPVEIHELLQDSRGVSINDLLHHCLVTPGHGAGATQLQLLPGLVGHLRADAEQAGTAEETMRTVARIRSQSGLGDCGLGAAFSLEDWSLCAQIIDQWWLKLSRGSHHLLTEQVLLTMPTPALIEQPRTAHMAERLGSVPAGTVPVELPTPEELPAFVRTDEAARTLDGATLAMQTLRSQGRFVEADALGQASAPLALAIAERGGSVPPTILDWHVSAALSAHHSDDDDATSRLLTAGWTLRSLDTKGHTVQELALCTAVLKASRGQMRSARKWLDELNRLAEFPPLFTSVRQVADAIRALIDVETAAAPRRGDFSGLTHAYRHAESWLFVAVNDAYIALAENRPKEALSVVEGAVLSHPIVSRSDGIHRPILESLRARAHIALGNANAARNVLVGIDATHRFGAAPTARLHLLTGDHQEARWVAATALSKGLLPPRDRIEVELIRAAADVELGATDDGIEAAREAVAVAEQHGCLLPLLTLHEPAQDVLMEAIPELRSARTRLSDVGFEPLYPARLVMIDLTERENVVLQGLVTMSSLDDLAGSLFVSRNTVKSQMRSLYAKLGAHSREEALAIAADLGLL